MLRLIEFNCLSDTPKTFTIKKLMSHCRQATFCDFLYSANACFQLISPFNINLCFCVCSQRIPKICPWDLKPDLVSGYQQMQSKGATQASLPNLICYLLQPVSLGLLSLCLRKPLNRHALHLHTKFIMWSFTTMSAIETFLFNRLLHCVIVSGPPVLDDLKYFTLCI